MKKFALTLSLCSLVLTFVFVPRVAAASPISIDFETYATGAIANGYDGWQITNPAWNQYVTNVNPISGNQSWVISSLVGSGSFGDQPFSPATDAAGEGANQYFSASVDFRPLPTTAVGDGVTISTDNGTGQRMDWSRIEYTANGWQLSFFDYDGANFVQSAPIALLANVIYNLNYTRVFNPGLQNDQWIVSLDGNPVFSGVGWEDFFADGAGSFGPFPVTVDRLLFRNASSVANSMGIMFDNLRYSSSSTPSAVPEPGSMVLLGTGLLGLAAAARRRIRKS